MRALKERLAGVSQLPYLPVLRAVEGAEEALQYKDVRAAGEALRPASIHLCPSMLV